MSPENAGQTPRKRHPRSGEVILYLQTQLDAGTRPSYSDVGRAFEISRHTVREIVKGEGDLFSRWNHIREEETGVNRKLFPKSYETAWFIGALFGRKGSVNPSLNKITFSAPSVDDPVLQNFRDIGSRLIPTKSPEKSGQINESDSGSASVNFFSKAAVSALGDFRRNAQAQTISERFVWVLSKEFITFFASGVIDSGSYMQSGERNILRFPTKFEETANFLASMLTMLGIREVGLTYSHSTDQYTVQVMKIAELRRFAEQVTSLRPEKQQILDAWKKRERKKRHFTYPQSGREIFDEWQQELGDHPTQRSINQKRALGKTKFPPEVYLKYFGRDEGTDKTSIATVRRKMQELAAMDEAARNATLDAIVIETEKKNYSTEDIIREGKRILAEYGKFTTPLVTRLHRTGETPYSVSAYIYHLGAREGSTSPSFSAARTLIENTATQVYP